MARVEGVDNVPNEFNLARTGDDHHAAVIVILRISTSGSASASKRARRYRPPFQGDRNRFGFSADSAWALNFPNASALWHDLLPKRVQSGFLDFRSSSSVVVEPFGSQSLIITIRLVTTDFG
ncbi:MAG: hypothetical protein R3C11_18595 [Planctomycetaceae bacterium]